MHKHECLDGEWAGYLSYIKSWVNSHDDDWYKGQSPMRFEEWLALQNRIWGKKEDPEGGIKFVVRGWDKDCREHIRVELNVSKSETLTEIFDRANILCRKGDANINGEMIFNRGDYDKPIAFVEAFRHNNSGVIHLASLSNPREDMCGGRF